MNSVKRLGNCRVSDVKQGLKQIYPCSAVKGRGWSGSCDVGLKELSCGQYMASQTESRLLLKECLFLSDCTC